MWKIKCPTNIFLKSRTSQNSDVTCFPFSYKDGFLSRSSCLSTKWSSDLKYSTSALSRIRRAVRDARSDQSACNVKPDHLYNYVPTIFFKLLLWPTITQPFFLWVLKDGGWGSTATREAVNENHFYHMKSYL